MISITLDWLSFTYKGHTHEAHEFITRYASSEGSNPATAHNGYTAAYSTKNQVVCSWNDDRAEMGYHVVMGGTALRNVCEGEKISQEELLRAVVRSGGSITRLDLALDAREMDISLENIWTHRNDQTRKGSARNTEKYESDNGGYTIYVGSRQSEKFIRIYDKAAQSKLPGVLWKRFELETKGMVARALSSVLVVNLDWASTFYSLAKSMFDLPGLLDYQVFFSEPHVPVGLPKLEKISDREKWIGDQVIAAVSRHYLEYPDSQAVARLIATLDYIAKTRQEPCSGVE